MREYTCDLAVVGGGGAGIAAALRASEYGAKVILLEKANSIGGSTAMCRGIGAVGSRAQAASPDCDFTLADLMAEYLRQTNYLADAALVRQFLSNTGKTVDWLMDNGAEMDYVGNAQDKHIGSKFKTFFNWGTAKIKELRAMTDRVAARGGAILTKTEATGLIMENGRVAGLAARTRDGGELVIRCRAVALCSGGYGNNEEMVLKATKGVKVNMINSGGQTGDGIHMGLAAGAAAENLDCIEFHGLGMPFDKLGQKSAYGAPGPLGFVTGLPILLWVNRAGLRFANEELPEDISYAGNAAFRQGSEFFCVLSRETAEVLETKGAAAYGVKPPPIGPHQGQMLCGGLLDELDRMIEKTVAYRGETPERLAEAAGIDPRRFAATVAEYNGFCERGCDPVFGKRAQNLVPLRGALYAVELRAAELCSLGGLKINTDMEVLNAQLKPIPGLYAGGCDASGGLFNNAYVSLEGITIGWAFTSGRLIGESAARFLGMAREV